MSKVMIANILTHKYAKLMQIILYAVDVQFLWC